MPETNFSHPVSNADLLGCVKDRVLGLRARLPYDRLVQEIENGAVQRKLGFPAYDGELLAALMLYAWQNPDVTRLTMKTRLLEAYQHLELERRNMYVNNASHRELQEALLRSQEAFAMYAASDVFWDLIGVDREEVVCNHLQKIAGPSTFTRDPADCGYDQPVPA